MKVIMKEKIILATLFMFSISSMASTTISKYIGEENRAIKSLSANDIEELKKGSGWGLAKVAELNGMPGPAHLLEMEGKIDLTNEQKSQIQEIYNGMKAKAIALGKRLIHLEMKLDSGFANKTMTPELLEKSIEEIADVRAQLRIVHLSTHLKTPEILTNKQINLYNQLRGYSTDSCKNIPKGHNAKMWKQHNGCE